MTYKMTQLLTFITGTTGLISMEDFEQLAHGWGASTDVHLGRLAHCPEWYFNHRTYGQLLRALQDRNGKLINPPTPPAASLFNVSVQVDQNIPDNTIIGKPPRKFNESEFDWFRRWVRVELAP